MTQIASTVRSLRFVADIGATNARFGLLNADGMLFDSKIHRCADYPTLEAAARAYLSAAPIVTPPEEAAFAIAGPVTGDRIDMTNHPWSFSVAQTREALALKRLEIVNDFTAVAMSVPFLGPAHRQQIGDGRPEPNSVIGIIGPGTGLGVSGLVPGVNGWSALSGEGGHVTMAPINDREIQVLGQLRKRFDHVSAERVLSGQGLVNLYESLSIVDNREPMNLQPADVTEAALGGTDDHCVEALEMFCAMLGSVAGNLALTLGSRGGVYIAGGIVPRLGTFFANSQFRRRFIEKGRMRDFLAPIPTYVVVHPLPAFLGLNGILDKTP